jgi:hypothetical protein
MPTSQGFRDLKVYRLAFRLAMEIFHESESCGYLSKKRELELRMGYEEVGRMLGGMIAHPERFS